MKNVLVRIPSVSAMTLGFCVMLAQSSHAVPISWVDWTAADPVSATGIVEGVNVDFSGDINPAAQIGDVGDTNFWASNPSTYTSIPEVDNPPPDSDIIRLTGGAGTGTQTITFSSPVVDPVMAILSLGNVLFPATYNFDTEFEILNNGPGAFGNGPLTELPGNILQGGEGNGIIQFSGSFTSISWTVPTAEFWHGFTIGIADVVPPPELPEPSSLLSLLALGAVGAGSALKRQTKVEIPNQGK